MSLQEQELKFRACALIIYILYKTQKHALMLISFRYLYVMNIPSSFTYPHAFKLVCISLPQPYHPAGQDWLPTEAKQGLAWSVPEWETSWEN